MEKVRHDFHSKCSMLQGQSFTNRPLSLVPSIQRLHHTLLAWFFFLFAYFSIQVLLRCYVCSHSTFLFREPLFARPAEKIHIPPLQVFIWELLEANTVANLLQQLLRGSFLLWVFWRILRNCSITGNSSCRRMRNIIFTVIRIYKHTLISTRIGEIEAAITTFLLHHSIFSKIKEKVTRLRLSDCSELVKRTKFSVNKGQRIKSQSSGLKRAKICKKLRKRRKGDFSQKRPEKCEKKASLFGLGLL